MAKKSELSRTTKVAKKIKLLRKNEAPLEREKRLAKNREHRRLKRASETPEQRAVRLMKAKEERARQLRRWKQKLRQWQIEQSVSHVHNVHKVVSRKAKRKVNSKKSNTKLKQRLQSLKEFQNDGMDLLEPVKDVAPEVYNRS